VVLFLAVLHHYLRCRFAQVEQGIVTRGGLKRIIIFLEITNAGDVPFVAYPQGVMPISLSFCSGCAGSNTLRQGAQLSNSQLLGLRHSFLVPDKTLVLTSM